MTDSVPAPMVQIPAETVEQLREALDQIPAAPVEREGLYPTLYWAARAVVDAATPAASVPAADILELANGAVYADFGQHHPHDGDDEDIVLAVRASDLRTLVAAAEQSDKGEAADTPRDDETIKCPTCGVARGWNEDGRLTRGIWTLNCVRCGSFQIEIEDAPAAPVGEPRSTRGGYSSTRQVGDLAPPPKGPAPGARVPVNDEAEAAETFQCELDADIAESMKDPEYAEHHHWIEYRETHAIPFWDRHGITEATFKAGFRAARQGGNSDE